MTAEAIRFADFVPVALWIVVLLVAVGVFGSRLSSLALVAGLVVRAGILGLRATKLQAFAREFDARYFTDGSLSRVNGGTGYYFRSGSSRYEQYLAILRKQGGLSIFGLEVLGVVVWACAGFVLLAAVRRFAGDDRPSWPMWAFALSPSGLLFTNGVLRESYETMFVVLALWVYLRLRQAFPSPTSRVPVLATAAILSMGLVLHTALGLSGVVVVLGTELRRGLQRETRRPGQVAVYLIGAAIVLMLGSSLTQATDGLEAERTFRIENPNTSNTDYMPQLPNLGAASLPVEFTVGYVLYVVSPLPWRVRGPVDLIALAESGLRVLVMFSVVRRRRSTDVVTALLVAVAVQLAFSLGTANWGTSLRHHYVSLPALVLIASLPLFKTARLATANEVSETASPTATPAIRSDK
jgi:hypothetical protein